MEKMEMQGTWTKDEEGFMDFETSQLQRLYEAITDQYHQVYNRFLEEFDDEEEAHNKALATGYEMITDYKEINGTTEFVTTYKTPVYTADIWYETDAFTGKKVFDKGFIRISSKA
ncbi:hypothetical protein ACFPIB_16285 [Adhaeribacter terreus]|uniref:Uncharacterized protein n=2 Tax=Adhaeribacter terreus TaxID=529703 RepID=A0ABW0EH34_9BACT